MKCNTHNKKLLAHISSDVKEIEEMANYSEQQSLQDVLIDFW